MRFRSAILVIWSLMSLAGTAWAQLGTGSIVGIITDQSGGVIVGAQVMVTDVGTGF